MTTTELFQEKEDGTPREYTAEEVQFLLVEYLYGVVDYWVKLEKYSLKYRLEGFTHSMWVGFNGCAGGFDGSCYMTVYSTPEQIAKAKEAGANFFPEGEENAHEIDTHVLQANSSRVPDLLSAGPVPRQWTEEETTDLFRHEVATRLGLALDIANATNLEKGYHFFHSLLELIENGFSNGMAISDLSPMRARKIRTTSSRKRKTTSRWRLLSMVWANPC